MNQPATCTCTISTKRFQPFMTLALVAGLTLTGCASKQPNYSPIRTANPSKLTHDPKEAAKIRTELASQYVRDHQLDDAQRQLERAFESDPKYAPAYDMMGVLLQQEGSPSNMKKAEGYFKKAISLDPNFTQANNNYGVYLSQMSRYPEALQQFQIAGSTLGYEGRAGALENLGRTALKVNQIPMATQAFLKALDTNRQSLIARVELVDIYLNQGNYQNAQMLYGDLVLLMGEKNLGSRVTLQGIRLAKAYGNSSEQQRLTQQLFDLYPSSDEAKQMKQWLGNPAMAWK